MSGILSLCCYEKLAAVGSLVALTRQPLPKPTPTLAGSAALRGVAQPVGPRGITGISAPASSLPGNPVPHWLARQPLPKPKPLITTGTAKIVNKQP